MLEKKGIPETPKHTLKGCIKVENRIYVPLDEIVVFCKRFSNMSGTVLADTFKNTLMSDAIKNKLPETLLVHGNSRIGRWLTKIFTK